VDHGRSTIVQPKQHPESKQGGRTSIDRPYIYKTLTPSKKILQFHRYKKNEYNMNFHLYMILICAPLNDNHIPAILSQARQKILQFHLYKKNEYNMNFHPYMILIYASEFSFIPSPFYFPKIYAKKFLHYMPNIYSIL